MTLYCSLELSSPALAILFRADPLSGNASDFYFRSKGLEFRARHQISKIEVLLSTRQISVYKKSAIFWDMRRIVWYKFVIISEECITSICLLLVYSTCY
jgi:hypothetical protein